MIIVNFCNRYNDYCKFEKNTDNTDECSFISNENCNHCKKKRVINVALEISLEIDESLNDSEIDALIQEKINNNELRTKYIEDFAWDDADGENPLYGSPY